MSTFWNDEPEIRSFLGQVTSVVRSAVAPASPYIRPILLDLVDNRGKMLRPALIYIASLTGNPGQRNDDTVVMLASAMEMLHMASLIHDDVIDDSAVRRGRPTMQVQTGVKKAVIAGDYLLTRSFTQLTTGVDGVNPEVVKQSICRLCDSEIDQDSELWDFSISEARYIRRIAGKTASLFSLSLYLGAAASGADQGMKDLFRRIGYGIGMFFQIQDDLLDYAGSSRKLGKPAGNDLRCGLATLPLICALQNDAEGRLHRLLKGKTRMGRRTAARVAELTVRLGGFSAAEARGRQYRERVLKDIAGLGPGEASRLLTGMMNRLDNREA